MPLQNTRLQPVDLLAEQAELIDEAVQRPSRQFRQTILRLVQSFDGGFCPAWPFGRDDAELREVTAQGVDQHRPLPDQQVTGLVKHQGGLLIDGLDRHEAHRRPGDRLADCLGIGGVGLSPLHTRRTVLRAGGWAAGLALLGPLPPALPPARAEGAVEIRMRGNADGLKAWFDPIGVLVEPGQMIRWINVDPGNSHTSTAHHPANGDRPLCITEGAAPWHSDYLLPDQSFELRLIVEGVYDYFCLPHEEAGMVGRIVVGHPQGNPPAATLREPAQRLLPSLEEIVRRKSVHVDR